MSVPRVSGGLSIVQMALTFTRGEFRPKVLDGEGNQGATLGDNVMASILRWAP